MHRLDTVEQLENIKIYFGMYQDASCATDPFDEKVIDGDLAHRWFSGLSQTVIARAEPSPFAKAHENSLSDRTTQRFEDIEDENAYMDIVIDPIDIIPDDGTL